MCAHTHAQVSFGRPEKINADWRFTLDDPDAEPTRYLRAPRWETVRLPHDWSVRGQLSPALASCTGWLPGGVGTYVKTLDIPTDKQGERVYIYFEGVYNRSKVWMNGHLLGDRPNGYVSFMYDITPYVRFGGGNELKVVVDHSRSADSRWYTGSGIYRDVWLVYSDPVHIAQWGVYAYPAEATTERGVLAYETEVVNHTGGEAGITVTSRLVDLNGNTVATGTIQTKVPAHGSGTVSGRLEVDTPELWSIDRPYLYTLHTTVSVDGRETDRTETETGFRTFTFDPDMGFALNGEWMKVKGVCLHHDAGVLGAAVPWPVWHRRLSTLKELGCNAIRTSHNPQAPDLYALADRLGLLVLDEAFDEWEFPKRKWLEGWNVGTPGFEGSYDFFEEWGERDLADMVRRDRNHISIFAWSIGNEVDYPNDPYSHPVLGGDRAGGFTQASYGGYNPDAPDANRLGEIARRLAAVVRRYDATRPVTAGLAGVAMSNETGYPDALDIAGYNYTENRYITDHETYPDRVIYGSENRPDKAAWDAVTGNEHIFGQFLWTGIDYLGESSRWPSRGFYSGLLDFAGYVKPRGYFRRSLWSEEPMAYIGTYPIPGHGGAGIPAGDAWSELEAGNGEPFEKTPSMDAWPVWNYTEGQPVRVVCYTNGGQAKLLLDGREVGSPKPYDPETGIIYWDIPFRAGTLEAIAIAADGRETARSTIRTSGRPHAIQIDSVTGEGFHVRQISLQVVDSDGIPVMLSDDEITCTVTGQGRLLGLEAGNNTDMGDYTDNRQRAFHGRLMAYVEVEGPTEITFTAPWLEPVTLELGSAGPEIDRPAPAPRRPGNGYPAGDPYLF